MSAQGMEINPLLPDEVSSNGLCKILCVYMGLGSVLMCTYVWGVVTLNSKFSDNEKNHYQAGAMNLWGSIYDDTPLLLLYYSGFVVATVGYFMNLGYIVQVADRFMSKGIYDGICFWFTIFFVSELMWMPCCVSYISDPSDCVWWLLFIQLKVSGIAAIMWAWHNVEAALTEDKRGCPWVGAAGAIMFAGHCAILDGLVWSFYFGTDGRFPPNKL